MATFMDSTQPPPLIQPTQANGVPGYLLPLLELLLGASALSRSTPLNLFAISLGIYWLFALAIDKPQGGEWTHVYTQGCRLMSVVLRIVSARWLMKASDFERKGKEKGGKEGDEKSEKEKRTWWGYSWDVFEIGSMSSRGIGWNFQVRNLPQVPSPTTPRLPFAITHLLSAATNILLVDLSYHFLRHFSPITSLPILPLTSKPLPLALFNAWLIYLQARWTMSALLSMLAAITVPLHIYSPSEFPPLFGSFANAYTVKRFWAFTWHQMMRTLATPYTSFLVKKLGLDERKKSTYWVKVTSAFFFAWIVHVYGTLITGGGLTADFYRYAPQVLAFWAEEKVIDAGEKMGCKGRKWRVLGYVWVFVFEGVTLLAWFGPAIEGGAHLKHPLGFSVVDRILN